MRGDYGFDISASATATGRLLKHKRDAYIVRLNGIYARNLAAKGVVHVTWRGALHRRAHGGGERSSG